MLIIIGLLHLIHQTKLQKTIAEYEARTAVRCKLKTVFNYEPAVLDEFNPELWHQENPAATSGDS